MKSKTFEQMAEESADRYFDFENRQRAYEAAYDAFIAGYKAAQQWISVNDRLPKKNAQVIAYGRGTTESKPRAQPARMLEEIGGESLVWEGYDIIDYDGVTDALVEVTHWMPLPEAPKEEE